jgi:hypothetical protein
MRVKLSWAGMLLLLLLGYATPTFAADPPRDADKPDKADNLVPLGEVTGVLKHTAGSEAGFTLHVTLQYLVANPGAERALLRDQQTLLVRQQQIMATHNPALRQREMQALVQALQRTQRDQANLFRVKQVEKDIEIQPGPDMKVRSLHPPVAHDEQGKLKEYTALELKKLRGEGKLPGYAAALTDLQDGQVVKVHLARKKDATEPKDKDKKDPPADEKPLATMILIEADPQTRK